MKICARCQGKEVIFVFDFTYLEKEGKWLKIKSKCHGIHEVYDESRRYNLRAPADDEVKGAETDSAISLL